MPNGYTIYDGPSLLDGKPIVAVAITAKSRNTKTGGMIQTYILRRDIDPREASKSGEDFSICGTCKHRGAPTNDPAKQIAVGRTCYVNLGQGVLIVWRGFQAGRYPRATGAQAISALGQGRKVRLGTYGDPSAVPSYVWDSLIARATGHTAYSHQARTPGADYRPDLYMRSADTAREARAAWALGERTFRVIMRADVKAGTDGVIKGREIACPASKEAGQRVQCHDCGLCAGARVQAKSIAIIQH